jgi:hypothetical protein
MKNSDEKTLRNLQEGSTVLLPDSNRLVVFLLEGYYRNVLTWQWRTFEAPTLHERSLASLWGPKTHTHSIGHYTSITFRLWYVLTVGPDWDEFKRMVCECAEIDPMDVKDVDGPGSSLSKRYNLRPYRMQIPHENC